MQLYHLLIMILPSMNVRISAFNNVITSLGIKVITSLCNNQILPPGNTIMILA